MSDQAALLAAIVANADEDTPRLVYADWLDENLPDKTPSPAAGPSARAEYIRVQCRLARLPFDEPDYPELLEREKDLADWLNTHAPPAGADRPDLPDDLEWAWVFDSGEWRTYARGFLEETEYTDFDDEPSENIERILGALPEAFANSTVRTLRLEDAFGEEIVGLMQNPVVAGLRGLDLSDISDEKGADAVRAIAASPHLSGLRRLSLEFDIEDDDLRELARSPHLTALEHLSLDYPSAPGLKILGSARWFRNLRALRVWMDSRDALKAVADLPPMPNLVSLSLRGDVVPPAAAVRKFATSGSFPRLARLEFENTRLAPELVAVLARGPWPLRHLVLNYVPVGKAGAEALAAAHFAETLRVLDLTGCDITAGGVQALAASERLAGLRHLDLSANPVGPGGLAALVRGRPLRGLRKLELAGCNNPKAPLDAASVLNFLTSLDMPDLRHLRLFRLPVGVRGARVIAAGGPFANLTRLDLNECMLRENGARAIVESGAFPHLTALIMPDNGAGKGVAKLANPKVFPRLGRADVSRNRIPKGPLSRLRKRPGVQV
jgi:uncharacterized protein (TIGR02996 family)